VGVFVHIFMIVIMGVVASGEAGFSRVSVELNVLPSGRDKRHRYCRRRSGADTAACGSGISSIHGKRDCGQGQTHGGKVAFVDNAEVT